MPSQPQHSPTSGFKTDDLDSFSFRNTSKEYTWEYNFHQAQISLNQKNFSQALSLAILCRDTILLSPQQCPERLVATHLLTGQCYFGLEQFNKAYNEFNAALAVGTSTSITSIRLAEILGNLAEVTASMGDRSQAITYFKQRLTVLDKTSYQQPALTPLVHTLKIATLKELSALHLAENVLEDAEKYTYELAKLQDPGLERGKTLLLLTKIFQASDNLELALKTARNAQSELLLGEAEHYEPRLLANAILLEARLLLYAGKSSAAAHRLDAAYHILETVYGRDSVHTILCSCDQVLIDLHQGKLITAYDTLEQKVTQARQLSDIGIKDPALRPYLYYLATTGQRLGELILLVLDSIERLPTKPHTLSMLSACLDTSELRYIAQPLIERFTLLPADQRTPANITLFLEQESLRYFKGALTYFMQTLSSLKEEFGMTHSETASIYERLRDIHYTLGNSGNAAYCDLQAARIRKQAEERNSRNEP